MSNDVLTPLQEGKGPGAGFVGLPGIWLSLLAVLAFATLLVYSLLALWPRTSASLGDRPRALDSASVVSILRAERTGSSEDTAVDNPAGSQAAQTTGSAIQDTTQRNPWLETPRVGHSPGIDRNGYLYCAPNDSTSRFMPIATADTVRGADCVRWLWAKFPIWVEQRLFLIVVLAGALGATIHALRSLAWYIGNRQLVYSWLAYYLALPLVGSLLATAFYLIIRGGFFSPQTNVQDTSLFGFAAMAVIIGMFTTPAVLKLKEVAETILTKPSPGADTAPQQSSADPRKKPGTAGAPVILKVERLRKESGNDRDALLITGAGFAAAASATVNDAVRTLEFRDAEEVLLPLNEDDLKRIEIGGDFEIIITNPDGVSTKPFDFA